MIQKISTLILLVILFSSCSNDDGNTPLDEVLLSKIVTHNHGNVHETKFKYEGKKLIQMSNVRFRHDITYDGDKIVNFKRFFPAYNSQDPFELYFEVKFYYDSSDRLIKFERYINDGNPIGEIDYKCEIIYDNPDNLIYVELDFSNYTGTTPTDYYIVKLENNEIRELWQQVNDQYVKRHDYLYDNNHHPYRNVTGMDKIAIFGIFFESFHESGISSNFGNLSNCTTLKFQNLPSGTDEISFHTFEYNEQGFPITIDKGNDYVADYLHYN